MEEKNRDQKCFEYLEKLVSEEKAKDFEKDLEENKTLKSDLALWKTTYIQDVSSVNVPQDLEQTLLLTANSTEYKKIILIASSILLALLGIYFLISSNIKEEEYGDLDQEITPKIEANTLDVADSLELKPIPIIPNDTILKKDSSQVKIDLPVTLPEKKEAPKATIPKDKEPKALPAKSKKVNLDTVVVEKEKIEVISELDKKIPEATPIELPNSSEQVDQSSSEKKKGIFKKK